MDGPPTEVETRQLDELIQAVDDLRRRVATLEQRSHVVSSSAPPELSFPTPASPPSDATSLLAALGRLLLGIAGAYLLRAITEATLLPQLAGTIAGLLYAGAWLVSAERLRAANRLTVAGHALTASLIAGPLLWEATVRFHSLTAGGAAVALALFIICGQALAWRRGLAPAAGIAAFAGAVTAIALIIATLNPVPFALALLAAAAAVEYGAVRGHALASRWIIALALDFCVFLIVYLATRPQGLPDGYAPISLGFAIAIPAALLAVYLASTVTRTLIRRLPVVWFEVAQVAVSIALGLACGLRVAHGSGMAATGAFCLATGALTYVAALLTRSMPRRNFHAYATFALLLVAIGSLIDFPAPLRTVVWSTLAVAAVVFGERARMNTLRMHGAFYLTAAAWTCGLFGYAVETLLGATQPGWPPSFAMLLATGTSAVAFALTLCLRTTRFVSWTNRLPAAIAAAILCWGATGLAAGCVIRIHLDPALAATFRTGLIAFFAIALARFGRTRNLTELIWVLYPWMVFGALKLLTDDFRQGRPATLFLSLLLYGGTLIALPRLVRRAAQDRSDLS